MMIILPGKNKLSGWIDTLYFIKIFIFYGYGVPTCRPVHIWDSGVHIRSMLSGQDLTKTLEAQLHRLPSPNNNKKYGTYYVKFNG